MSQQPMSEAEAQQRVANAFSTLDAIYLLHAPEDDKAEVWQCGHCKIQWPCETETLILDGLGLTTAEVAE